MKMNCIETDVYRKAMICKKNAVIIKHIEQVEHLRRRIDKRSILLI